jgi:hypothetical protein
MQFKFQLAHIGLLLSFGYEMCFQQYFSISILSITITTGRNLKPLRLYATTCLTSTTDYMHLQHNGPVWLLSVIGLHLWLCFTAIIHKQLWYPDLGVEHHLTAGPVILLQGSKFSYVYFLYKFLNSSQTMMMTFEGKFVLFSDFSFFKNCNLTVMVKGVASALWINSYIKTKTDYGTLYNLPCIYVHNIQ